MAKPTTDVAVKTAAGLPANIDFSGTDLGFSEAGQSAFAIPFLQMLQSLSKQCKKSDPQYIKGAEEGDLYDTVSEKLFKGEEGVVVIPVFFRNTYNEWVLREDGGGFRGVHSEADGAKMLSTCTKDTKGRDILPNGNQLVDTRNHFVVIVDGDSASPAVINLTTTQIKKSKKWMSQIQMMKLPNGQKAPMASQMYRITSTPESNDFGSWAGYKIDFEGFVGSAEVYASAKDFQSMVCEGTAQVVHTDDDLV